MNSNIAEKAFAELFPNKDIPQITLTYSAKFSAYNGNVKYTKHNLMFGLSKQWREVAEEIQIGLIQNLLIKVYKQRATTINTELYNHFMKQVGRYSTVEKTDPIIEESFDRVNELYFSGFLDKPNLVWGSGLSKLGHYDYGSNTILITKALAAEPEMMDYVMYHEMLHKKHRFSTKDGRSCHHTKEFRLEEAKWHDKDAEAKLKKFLRKKKLKSLLKFW